MHSCIIPDLSDISMGVFADGGRGQIDQRTGRPQYDCWGLVMAVYARFGIDLPDFGISAHESAKVHAAFSEEALRWTRIEHPEAPCVVAMNLTPRVPMAVTHFGVFVGDGMLHIVDEASVRFERRLSMPPWPRRIRGYYAWTR